MQKRVGALGGLLQARDMTTGSPMHNLIQFSLPLLIGNFIQQLYNTVDSMVVGKYVGDNALAAVGASGPLLNLMIVLFMGIATGSGILVSQYFGAKDRNMLSKTVGVSIVLTFAAAVIITAIGIPVTRPFLQVMKTPAEILDMATKYLTIIFAGMVGLVYYNMLAGILRGLGDSVSPLIFLTISCLINVALDLLFVIKFEWEVMGAAVATVIAQSISAVLCMLKIARMREVLTLDRQAYKPQLSMVKNMLRIGLPSGLTQAVFSMSAILVQSLTNSFGTAVIAASVAVMRIDGFAMMPNFTFGVAMTTYTGQNVGAERFDRVEKGAKAGVILGITVSTVLTLIILALGRPLAQQFSETEEVVTLSLRFLRILAFGYIAFSVTQVLGGIMRGAGNTVTPMWTSIFTTVFVRVPLAYLHVYLTKSEAMPNGSSDALYVSTLLAWVLGAVLIAVIYRRGKWKEKVVSRVNAAEI